MKAKKSYGQHFLNREDIAERIANSLLQVGDTKQILEVGPGKGMLTKYLQTKAAKLLVVEADRDMVGYLMKNFPVLKEQIIAADFLKVPINKVIPEAFCLIGNYPYNISSQILFKMLEYREQIPEMVGMFQKEVAERVVAAPGSKTYGVISVLIQAYYEGEYLFSVPKGAFSPPPKVESGVIRLTRKSTNDLGCDYKMFRRVVKQAFSQRRKMLRNTMKTFIKGSPLLTDTFFQQRPEQLSVADFVQLTQWVIEQMDTAP